MTKLSLDRIPQQSFLSKLIKRAMSVALVAALIAGSFSVAVTPAFAAGYVTLNSFSGNPGVSLTVSGGGWNASESVSIYLGSVSGSPAATVSATEFGEFSTSVTVPANTPQGALAVIAVGGASGQSQNSYYVVPFSASISVNAPSHAPFATATVSGSGFAPNEMLTLDLAGTTSQAQADGSGSFSGATIKVPPAPSNLYFLRVTGDSSGASAFEYFWIDALYPSASPSTYYLQGGQTLGFSGSGFAAGETIEIRESSSATVLSSFSADGSGAFSNAGGFAVPNSFAGSERTFTLRGVTSGASASANVTIGVFYGYASPSSYYLMPGTQLMFTGGGFGANETINVYRGSETVAATSFAADAAGSFSNAGAVTIPANAANSTVTYKLVGADSNAQASVSVGVGSFYPTISPSSYYVQAGSEITVTGSGFAPNETVTLGVQGSASTTTATADSLGNISGTLAIPYTGSDGATVTATGEDSNAIATVGVTLAAFYPTITPSSYYVFGGDMLSFTGTGFAPNETVTISTTGTSTTVTANGMGAFSAPAVKVPFTAMSSLTYTFTGGTSGANASLMIGVGTAFTSVWSDNYYVTPNTTVNISGSGFAANENITVSYSGLATTSTVAANASGAVNLYPVLIPYGVSGSAVTVTLTGQESGATGNVTITLAPISVQVSPSEWYVYRGSSVTFTGTGFAPNETVSIRLNGSEVETATANAMGGFSEAVTVPLSDTTGAFTFVGQTSGASASVTLTLAQFYSSIWQNSYYAQGGTPITIYGAGFGPNENVTLTMSGTNVGTVAADASGAFTFNGSVPYAASGDKTFQAVGSQTGASATSPFTLAPVYAGFWLSAYAGAPGSSLALSGSGYLPNEPIVLTTDRTGGDQVLTFNADASGSFNNIAYAIPSTFTEGNLTLTLTGSHSFDQKSVTVYVTGN